VVATLTNMEGRMLKKDADATVETMPNLNPKPKPNPSPNPNPNPSPNPNPNPNPNPHQVDTMLSRMWTAESEKAVTAALIDEYAAAATTAVGPEKAELETLTLALTLNPYPNPGINPSPTLILSLRP
jgi:hypothetical protein